MNEHAKAWIEALRGGDYVQTTGRLRRPGKFFWQRDTFCATGVLYDLYLRAQNQSWPKNARQSHLPDAVLEWAGVSRELEQIVVALNDSGQCFRDLASIIDARFHRDERSRLQLDAAQIVAGAIKKAQEIARHGSAIDNEK
jgi:hypothetical protein